MKIERLEVLYADTPTTFDADGRDLVAGLGMSPKWIPSHYSYDAKGSELFDKVTEAPAYYLYRRELDVIEARAAEIAELFDGHAVVELGSGAAKKTRTILRALASTRSSLMYQPVDISEEILLSSSRELIHELGSLRIRALAGRYAEALAWLEGQADGPRWFV